MSDDTTDETTGTSPARAEGVTTAGSVETIPSGSTEVGVPFSQLRNRQNQLKTMSLFLEHNYHRETTDPAPFTLQPSDHKGKLSLKRLYLECSDPTEYEFALRVFGDWPHWQRLAGSPFFKPHIEQWRDELEVKLRSEAIKKVREFAKEDKTSAKWLAEKGWQKSTGKRGRPSNEEVERERQRLAEIGAQTEDDATRVFGGDKVH